MRFAAVALLVLLMPGVPQLLAEQPTPHARQLLERAHKLTDFRAKGSEPFRLTADFKLFDMASDQREGTYMLLWLSPEKWREEISLTGFTQVRILVGNRMWRQRSGPTVPRLVSRLEQVLDFQHWLEPVRGDKFSSVKERKLDDVPADCFKLRHRGRGSTELCFDPASGVLLSVGSNANGTFFSNYEEWGAKLIPHSITNFNNHISDVEFTVTQVSSPERLSPGAFTPPPGSVELPVGKDSISLLLLDTLPLNQPYQADLRRQVGPEFRKGVAPFSHFISDLQGRCPWKA